MRHRMLVTMVGGALLLVAGTASAQSGIRVTKDRTAASTTTSTSTSTTTSTAANGEVITLPTFSVGAYPTLTLSNIAAHLLGGDSAEIRMAQLAEGKATAQAVHDYATMLANDHSAHLVSATKALNDEKVVADPVMNDVEAQRMSGEMVRLTSMPAGAAWDAEFVRFQVQHHQNEIDLLSANTGSVHGHEMHELLEDTISALTKHRDSGKSTATRIGIALY